MTLKNKQSVIDCAISDFSIDQDGIINYRWLISNQERTDFGVYLMESYTKIVQDNKSLNQENILPYKIFGVQLLHQIISVFQGDLLRERAIKNNVIINVPNDWKYWYVLLNEKQPQEPNIIQNLKRIKKNNNNKLIALGLFERIIKFINIRNFKNHFGNLKIKPITKNVLENFIIATQRTPLIIRHAEEEKKQVVFCRSDRWFKPISQEELQESIVFNDKEIENKIFQMIEEGYKKYGIEFKKHSRDFIQNILNICPALIRIHYQRLCNNPSQLPKEIWTGTTGQMWDTILRLATMKNGGISSAHDHGSGWSYLTHPLRGINELWGCDYFITFNDFHASEMKKMAPSWPRYEQPPEIKGLQNGLSLKIKSYPKFKNKSHKIKNIFIMGDAYDNDIGRLGPGTPNNFLVDTQARLISILKEADYNVILKMHPESESPPPQSYETVLGGKISWNPFAEVKEEADLVIFLCIYSTAFTEALATNLPVVLIDFFGFPWTQKGKELIEKRCSIYQGEYEDCRAQIDKNQFLSHINHAASLSNNHEFFEKYFL